MKISIRFPKGLAATLKAIAKARHLPFAAIVREAAQAYADARSAK